MQMRYLVLFYVVCFLHHVVSLVQAQGFSTTVVKEGEDAIIECGLQTKVAEGYLKWEAITNDTTEVLAFHVRDGNTNCDDRIINCTLYANGSIQLESVSKEDGARYYRCLRGDDNGYNYFSDHRLLVLSKGQMSSSPSIETPHRESVSSYNMGKKGVLHGYNAPVCKDDVDGNLPVDCYPPSGIIVDRGYETIQCNCTDSDGLMDSVIFPVSKKTTSSPPSIETPHRESVSSYNIGKEGVLHNYNAPVCEDDVDGNLPVVCYPPSGIIVDRGYETIQCNCTDSDGLMDSVTFPVTSVTHWVPPGWKKAFISLSVISIILVLICLFMYMKRKKSKAYHPGFNV
ncbi:hyalin [Apostichopus japonicus]|uniref:Hyalin n=1 Tax=Stichopus japonicus TaxID=307972 RepID=A0A2G8KIT0_STIJA|nr:hyalin [Apostichopus japonicus]